MKPNRSLLVPALILLFSALISSSAQAQPAYTEIISPDPRANGQFGRNCGGLPDLTGDGVGEFYALRASRLNSTYYRMYVFHGKSKELLYQVLPTTCGIGFVSFQPAGDLNGDGVPELMLGLECGDQAGQVLIVNGQTGANLFTLNSPNPVGQGSFGRTLRLLPDMNGDGREDWLIHQLESASSAGRAYVIDSQTRKVIRTIQNRGTGVTFHMQRVEVIPDIDGDGSPELLLAGYLVSVVRDGQTIREAGRTLVRSLTTGEVLYELQNPDPRSLFGIELKGIGDINADKVGDIAVTDSENVHLFSGADGQWLRTLQSPGGPGGYFGGRLESLPDLNGDGVPELLVQESGFGLAHLYDGAASTPIKTIEYPGFDGTQFGSGTVQQAAPPGMHAFLFSSQSAGDSSEGRVYYMPFTPFAKPPQLKPLGPSNTGFGLQVTGDVGSKVEVQGTGDFKMWEPVASVTLGNQPAEVEDSAAASHARRFYRAVQRE